MHNWGKHKTCIKTKTTITKKKRTNEHDTCGSRTSERRLWPARIWEAPLWGERLCLWFGCEWKLRDGDGKSWSTNGFLIHKNLFSLTCRSTIHPNRQNDVLKACPWKTFVSLSLPFHEELLHMAITFQPSSPQAVVLDTSRVCCKPLRVDWMQILNGSSRLVFFMVFAWEVTRSLMLQCRVDASVFLMHTHTLTHKGVGRTLL